MLRNSRRVCYRFPQPLGRLRPPLASSSVIPCRACAQESERELVVRGSSGGLLRRVRLQPLGPEHSHVSSTSPGARCPLARSTRCFPLGKRSRRFCNRRRQAWPSCRPSMPVSCPTDAPFLGRAARPLGPRGFLAACVAGRLQRVPPSRGPGVAAGYSAVMPLRLVLCTAHCRAPFGARVPFPTPLRGCGFDTSRGAVWPCAPRPLGRGVSPVARGLRRLRLTSHHHAYRARLASWSFRLQTLLLDPHAGGPRLTRAQWRAPGCVLHPRLCSGVEPRASAE